MIEKKCEGERLLEIDNVHVADSGPPPVADATGKYLGYFENGCGEQWVFIGDRKTGEAVIRGGDTGWSIEYKASIRKPCAGLVLGAEEKQWIIACFMAMSNARYEVVEAAFAAGDFTEALLGMAMASREGPTVKPADDEDSNGGDGNHRKDERQEE